MAYVTQLISLLLIITYQSLNYAVK